METASALIICLLLAAIGALTIKLVSLSRTLKNQAQQYAALNADAQKLDGMLDDFGRWDATSTNYDKVRYLLKEDCRKDSPRARRAKRTA